MQLTQLELREIQEIINKKLDEQKKEYEIIIGELKSQINTLNENKEKFIVICTTCGSTDIIFEYCSDDDDKHIKCNNCKSTQKIHDYCEESEKKIKEDRD